MSRQKSGKAGCAREQRRQERQRIAKPRVREGSPRYIRYCMPVDSRSGTSTGIPPHIKGERMTEAL